MNNLSIDLIKQASTTTAADMDLTYFPIWASAIGIPALLFLWNLYLRSSHNVPISTFADLFALIAGVDLAAVANSADFQKLISDPELRNIATAVFLCLGLIALTGWLITMKSLEPQLESARMSAYSKLQKTDALTSITKRAVMEELKLQWWLTWSFSLFLAMVVIYLHVKVLAS